MDMLRDVNFAFPFRLKGTDKIHTKGLFKFHSMYNLFSLVMLGYTKHQQLHVKASHLS